MTLCVVVRELGLIVVLLLVASVAKAQQQPCEIPLAEEFYDLAVIKIDIGTGEIEEDYGTGKKEISEDPKDDPRNRPEIYDLPQTIYDLPQTPLEIVPVPPTPERRKDEMPVPMKIPNNDKTTPLPNKKPKKDLPN